jgi:ribosome maturation factor RimP
LAGFFENADPMFKDKVKTLLEDALKDDKSLFLIDFSVGADHSIKVVLDGDEGVTLADCMKVSRAIEHNLDRDEHDFSLEVTSVGAATPLTLPRQYPKNVGRKLKVRTETETVEGKLTEATATGVVLQWKTREPKPVGKGKVTVQKEAKIDFSDILEAKVIVTI